MHQEAEGRSDSGKKEDGDNLPAILAILRTIKNSEDAIDKAKTEVCSFPFFTQERDGCLPSDLLLKQPFFDFDDFLLVPN